MTVHAITHAQAVDHNPRAIAEETINQITHGFGLILAIVGAVALAFAATQTDDVWRVRSAAIYSTTLVALYAASTLSHSFLFRPRLRHFFRMLDQVCIYLLIAGTFTPFGLVFLREGWTLGVTVGMWSLAICGSVVKVFFSYLQSLSATSYVLLGWLPLAAMGEMFSRVPLPAMVLLIVGGLLYTVGTLFLARSEKHAYSHAAWHLLVVAASACHYWAILRYVIEV